MREAPSVVIAHKLGRLGASLIGYDPVAHETARQQIGESLLLASSWQEAVAGADAILLLTEWREFAAITPEELAAATDCRLVFDGRNVWEPAAMRAAGFRYHGIGRPVQPV